MSRAHKALIVDDNVDFAETLALQLVHEGCPALAAGSVSEALDILDADPDIGVIVSDIRMPEVDGLDFRRVLRHRFPQKPVILMTGLPLDKEEVSPADVVVLRKPFPVAALIAALARLE